MSVFDSFARDSLGPFLTDGVGEPVTITPKGGQPAPAMAIVLRDQLKTRATDKSSRVEYDVQIQVEQGEYPGGQPNVHGDTVELPVRVGDTRTTRKTISAILGQAGSMWLLGLD
jgi:hypothetical protein